MAVVAGAEQENPTPAGKVRRTQEERSSTTRGQLLEATIDALVELGYSATTTKVIAERAGVSRGAQLHHYPTKAELVAAAVEHLAGKLLDQFTREFSETPETDQLAYVVDALWSSFSAPLLSAWIELSIAARTDDELRTTLEPVKVRLQGEIVRRVYERFGESIQFSQALLMLAMTVCLFEGITLERSLPPSAGPAVADLAPVMIDTWKSMVRTMFVGP